MSHFERSMFLQSSEMCLIPLDNLSPFIPKFHDNRSTAFWGVLFTDKQTNKQSLTNRQSDRKTNELKNNTSFPSADVNKRDLHCWWGRPKPTVNYSLIWAVYWCLITATVNDRTNAALAISTDSIRFINGLLLRPAPTWGGIMIWAAVSVCPSVPCLN